MPNASIVTKRRHDPKRRMEPTISGTDNQECRHVSQPSTSTSSEAKTADAPSRRHPGTSSTPPPNSTKIDIRKTKSDGQIIKTQLLVVKINTRQDLSPGPPTIQSAALPSVLFYHITPLPPVFVLCNIYELPLSPRTTFSKSK